MRPLSLPASLSEMALSLPMPSCELRPCEPVRLMDPYEMGLPPRDERNALPCDEREMDLRRDCDRVG